MDKQKVKHISKEISKCVLAALAGGGLITLFAVMPGLPVALSPFIGQKRWYEKESYYKDYTKKVVKRLQKKGMIKILGKEGKTMLAITKLGKQQLKKWQAGDLKIQRPKKWDGIWRMVIFDIPEKRRQTRDFVREQLKELGFYYLQNSVWAYPYKCEEIILALAGAYDLLPYMIYLEANYLGNDKYLRAEFRL